MRGVYAILTVTALLAIGCGAPKHTAAPAPAAGVQWSDYAAGVQGRIDALAASKDCDGLQAEFDAADANNAVTLNRTGHNNAELMSYIDGQMRAAGCY